MRVIKIGLMCVAVLVAMAGRGQAGLIVTVPTSLSPGQQYRLVFRTSDQTDALSDDIAFYNSFVDAIGDTIIASDWRAIASTSSIDALTNTSTDPSPDGETGVPIFLLNNTLLATSYDDFWDGELLSPIYLNSSGFSEQSGIWTGTDPSGHKAPAGRAMGGPDSPYMGLASSSDGFWTYATTYNFAASTPLSMYAMSGLLTVPGASVPEPSSIALLLMGGVGLVGYGWRRKQNVAV